MTSNEWDANADSMPQGMTPDLFGGELFGDELIDIYHSAEGVGHEMMDSAIPTLLEATPDPVTSVKSTLSEVNHPGAHVAMTAAAMDDGFGAFRPSTSFSDLTSLVVSSAESNAPVTTNGAVVPAVAAPTQSKATTKKASGKKRASNATDGPPKKKGGARVRAASAASATTSRRGTAGAKTTKAGAARATKANTTQSAGQAALKLRKEQRALLNGRGANGVNGTPDPLAGTTSSRTTAPIVPKSGSNNAKPTGGVPSSISFSSTVPTKAANPGKSESITSEAAAATAAAAAVAAATAVKKVSVPASVPSSSSGKTTEADFKSVAQAAVTNLILNAGSSKQKADAAATSGRPAPETFTGKVDTSTEHIKALTSSNWVNACGGGENAPSSATATAASASADSKANNRARRQNLTPDERARQNRDRNREHARNTRLRKKAYVEELKRTLTELVSQRDANELEKRHAAQREMEQREVRFRVMEEFLKLRGRNEASLNRWVAILEEGFSLTLPQTPYRQMVNGGARSDANATEQVLKGASEVMTDASYLAALLGTFEKESKANVSIVYRCERKNFFMDGSSAVLDFSAAVVGGLCQVSVKGLMRAKFSPASNKLISAELIFDPSNVAAQFGNLKALSPMDKCDEVAAAAAAAANEADALLYSIQMPKLNVPSAISVGTKEVASVTCSESSDESTTDIPSGPNVGVVARRSTRQKH